MSASARRTASRPPAGIAALVERFDPDAIDVPGGVARIRLEVADKAWDAVIDGGRLGVEPASGEPDAVLSADVST
ncbi:MAG TPA: hypothetical protein VHF45_08055 [Thermoleophilaceae bacterium]|nr:hypothetical protein [Thermoleophilaceae bacterium]